MGNTTTLEIEKTFPTNGALLETIDKAIQAILLGGQSYAIGSRHLTRADLPTLYKMRQDCAAQDAADNATAGFFDDCYVAVWPLDR